MLVSTTWLHENLSDVKIIEVDFDPEFNYFEGHIPNAILLRWKDLLHDTIRDFAPPEKFSKVLGSLGIKEDDFIILYSDMGNRYAFYTYWLMKAYGHKDIAILDGGIFKWLKDGYEVSHEIPSLTKCNYQVKKIDWSSRILIWELLPKLNVVELIDARNREEYEGITTAPPEHKCEQTQVAGHIPRARNIPWTVLFNDNGTMKSREELEKIFSSISREKEIVVYCRTGARASAVWYALKEVLNYERVRLYDGSWVEYGNLVGVPIER